MRVELEEAWIFIYGAIIFLIGDLNLQLASLLVVSIINAYFRLRLSVYQKNFRLKEFALKTLDNFTTYFLLVALGHALDVVTPVPKVFRNAVIVALLHFHALSVMRNLSLMGKKWQIVTILLQQMFKTIGKEGMGRDVVDSKKKRIGNGNSDPD